MPILPFSRIRKAVLTVSVLFFVGWIGYQYGYRDGGLPKGSDTRAVIRTEAPDDVAVDFFVFWDVWQKVRQYYIDPQDIDVQKLVYGAVSGMVAAIGDPYTSFFPPQENKEFKEDLGGSFEGIGAQLGLKDGRIIIISPLRGMPAEHAGLKPNDYILKVDGKDTAGWTIDQAVDAIRGPRGTTVTLTILRALSIDTPEDISVIRSTITVPSVTSWIKTPAAIEEISEASEAAGIRKSQKSVAYIALTRFGDNTNADWNKAVTEILTAKNNGRNIAGLVLDMRSNPGGYLDGAVYIASEFIKSGTVVSQVNSDGSRDDFPVERRGQLTDMNVVVLVNGGSASAAEIVAGALRDTKRAKIVGEKTFGKGTVQTPFEVSAGAAVHITTGKWLLPGGDSISNTGLTPDIEIASFDLNLSNADIQLVKAIEVLVK